MIRYEGLRELAQALHSVNRDLYDSVRGGLKEAGELIRADARGRFEKYNKASADGFETRVRMGAGALVVVGQRLRKTTGLRPDFGALMMTKALLPARMDKLDQAAALVEET